MYRLSALLCACLLFGVSSAVHHLLGAPLSAAGGGGFDLGIPAGARTEFSITGSGDMDRVGKSLSPASGALSAASPDPGLQILKNTRGWWLVDADRGKGELVSRGPLRRMSVSLPILMYHHVRPWSATAKNPYERDLTVYPSLFEAQLQYLSANRYQSVSVRQLAAYLDGRGELPARPVILSFDDGYWDAYAFAFPMLKKYHFRGSFFPIAGLVGHQEYLSPSQIEEMASAGMEIGSHTVTHPDLAHWVKGVERERELSESKAILEELAGVTVQVLSYPSGSYDAGTLDAAARAGYLAALTTRDGATHVRDKVMELPRIRIRGEDPLPVFQWRIERYFPAVGSVQK